MKRKVYRPEPVKANTFFFEHLPASRDATASLTTTDAAATTSSSCPPQPDCSASPTSSWQLAPETGDAAIDAVLWSIYTPEAYQQTLRTALHQEDVRRRTFEAELEEKWAEVEALLVLNKNRRSALTSSTDLLSGVDEMLFWTAQDVVSRFHIDVTVGNQADATAAAPASKATEYADLARRARITLDFSVASSGGNGGDSAGVDGGSAEHKASAAPCKDGPGMHHAKAWSMNDEALLDYTRRPHHLRRLFAPLLQRRQELPKALTLLLNEIQVVQSQRLPRMEQQVESETMFTVPIYLPLQIISTFITRYLTAVSANEATESTQVNSLRALQRRIEQFQQRILAAAPDDETVAMMTEAERETAAREMWAQLFDELEAHRLFHEDSLGACTAIEGEGKAMVQRMREALEVCETASRQAMASLEADAALCTTALTQSGSHTLAVVEQIDAHFQANSDKLKASLQSKAFALEKSEEAQEKLMRRVREAVKDAYLEQLRYEELTQEWLQEQLALKHLTCSYEQVRSVMQTRHEEAVNARAHAESVHELLRETEALRQSLLTSCAQHIGRLETEEFYRGCHVANQAVTNAQQWSRAVADIAHLYNKRYAVVSDRLTNATWQMEYLMASERDWAVGNLLDVRAELSTVNERWEEVMALATKLDLFPEDSTPKISEGSRADGIAEVREAMRRLDDSKQVQRNVLTLKTFRARTTATATGAGSLTRPEGGSGAFVAGSGASAAVRLTKTATDPGVAAPVRDMGATV